MPLFERGPQGPAGPPGRQPNVPGSDQEILFNDDQELGAASGLKYDSAANKLTLTAKTVYQGTRFKIESVIGEVQTAATSATTLASYAMADETHVQLDAIVTCARRTNVTKAGTWKRSVAYRRTAAGAPQIVGAIVAGSDQETTAGDDVTFDLDGNTVRVRVTAADTDGRNWSCELRVQETTTL